MIANIRGRLAVVVGGGPVAERKIAGLLAAEADVLVIAPKTTEALLAHAKAGRIRLESRGYRDGDLASAVLAFAATDRDDVNIAVGEEARARGIWLNDAGDARRGDFATPAAHRAGPLLVTVDTGGRSPGFAKRVRNEIAAIVDERYAAEAATLANRNGRGDAPLICASRASALALTQTRMVVAQLDSAGLASTIETISTKGDRIADRSIAAIGSDGVFVKELESALRERRADYAVHSCKDLPSALADGMEIAAVTRREDPRDAFCSERYASFADLPSGARVGTSSPRRRAQLRALRPDLIFDDVRGNIDSRLRKLRDGEYDAIVLALAGLRRLGISATHTVSFPLEAMVPAVGQGALAIETRAGDPLSSRLRDVLQDHTTALAVHAERAYLRTLRGGCQAPVGAHAWIDGATLHLQGVIASPDGWQILRGSREAAAATWESSEQAGVELATELLERGGEAILGEALRPLAGCVVLLPRTQERASSIAPALRSAGADVVEAHDTATARERLGERRPHAIVFASSGSVGAIADYLAGWRPDDERPVIAAMGPASSEAAAASGFPPDVVSPRAEVTAFVETVTRYVSERGSWR